MCRRRCVCLAISSSALEWHGNSHPTSFGKGKPTVKSGEVEPRISEVQANGRLLWKREAYSQKQAGSFGKGKPTKPGEVVLRIPEGQDKGTLLLRTEAFYQA
jgi:hypothetical protein